MILTDNLRGALWICLASAGAAGMSMGIKAVAQTGIDSWQITFVRSLGSLCIVTPFILREGIGHLWTPKWHWHVLRGILTAVAMLSGYYAITKLPLATVTVLFFSTPLFVTGLAAVLLREDVGWRRWAATLVGFCGTIIVVRPSLQGVDPAMLYALLAAVCFAFGLIITKVLSRTESPATMMMYVTGVSSVCTLPAGVSVWIWPDLAQCFMLLAVILCGTIRSYADIKGFAAGQASVVAPFTYLRVLFAAIGGFMLFAEVPDIYTYVGASVIIGSTLYIAQREARLGKKPTGAGP
ncbi:MAG: DMT family transporter [Rhodospirillales bacterium]